jgi:hypothetical protein
MVDPCHISFNAERGKIVVVGGSGHDDGSGNSISSFFLLYNQYLLLFTVVVSMVLMPLRWLSLPIILKCIEWKDNRGGWRFWLC